MFSIPALTKSDIKYYRKAYMKKHVLLTAVLAMCLSLSTAFTSLAGQWQQDSTGWWYQDDNGGYLVNQWKELNGTWYYFNQDGYMVSNAWVGNYYLGYDGAMLTNTTTPDGYRVGADGAWIQDNNINELYNEKQAELTNIAKDSDYEINFEIKDLNNDWIKELIVTLRQGGHDEIRIWTYAGNKLIEVDVPENPYKYASFYNEILCFSRVGNASHESYAFCKLNDDYTFEFITGITWENGAWNDEGYDTYYIDDINGNHIQSISKTEYEAILGRY